MRFLFVGADAATGREILDPGLRRWTTADARALGPYRTGVAPALLRQAAGGTFDVWVASIVNWWPTHAAFPIIRARRKPFILWMEDWWWPDVRFGGRALRRYNEAVLRDADAVLVAGTKARQFALAAGARPERVFVALNSTESLSTRTWNESEVAEMRMWLAEPGADFVCLFLNRVVSYKGLDVLLRAWRAVEAHDADAHLAVVGDGPARAGCEAVSEALGLTRVRFLPAAAYDRVHLAYRASDLYVHPARFVAGERVKAEAWGFTLNEAMSVGTPVLATDAVAAAHDLIDHGVTGLIAPAGDADALAEGVLHAGSDRRRLAEIGEAGRRKVEEEFVPDKQAAVFDEAIRSAAGRETISHPRRPVRVLHLLACDDFAGAELLVASYLERLDRRVIDVELATLAPPGPIAERLRAAGIATHSLGGRGLWVAITRLARLVRRHYDVVNAHGFKTTMIARLLIRLFAPETALISSVHGLHVTEVEEVDTLKGRFALALERLGAPFVDVYEVNTQGAMDFLAAGGIDRGRMRYIPNAIDVAHWPLRRTDSDGRAAVVVCVARFVPMKRHVDLVRALGRLRAEGVPFRAVFVGYGVTLEPTRDLARTLALDGVVEFSGRASPDEIRSILAGADIFCLPTVSEGTVISVMEAMATGLPVVATDVNGVNEVVADGVTGLLVPPYRDDRLADALRTLLTDCEMARGMGAAGRRRVEQRFQLDRIVRAKEELYTRLAHARG